MLPRPLSNCHVDQNTCFFDGDAKHDNGGPKPQHRMGLQGSKLWMCLGWCY